jgi:hypothetical protein
VRIARHRCGPRTRIVLLARAWGPQRRREEIPGVAAVVPRPFNVCVATAAVEQALAR